jgi:hypothetical protein
MVDKNMFCFVVIGHSITLDADIVRTRPNLDHFLRRGCSAIGAGEEENGHPDYDYYYEKLKTLQKKVALLKELGWKQVKKFK